MVYNFTLCTIKVKLYDNDKKKHLILLIYFQEMHTEKEVECGWS